jgi:2-haloacid dehalogenase
MLAELKAKGFRTAILSNGSPEMLDGAVESADIGESLDAILSVESVGVFKPAPEVYALVRRKFGVSADEVLFVSSNGWDAAAATGYGFRSVWVNRAGDPMDRLPWRPARVISDLWPIPEIARGVRR